MIDKAMFESLNHRYVIDTSKPFHVSWWAATLGVSEPDLLKAVNAVGVRVSDVYYYLRQNASVSAARAGAEPLSPKHGAAVGDAYAPEAQIIRSVQ
jgi:Protein of unknown function (DUF3606)